MKVEKQLPLSSNTDTRARSKGRVLPTNAARVAGTEAKASEARPAKAAGSNGGFNLQLNQQLSAMQSTDRYLGELANQLSALKLNLSRQLSSPQSLSTKGEGDRESLVQGLQQVNELLGERSKRTAQSLDASFKLRLNEPLRSRFNVQGLDSLETIQHSGKETLVFSGGRALSEPLAVVLDDGMSEEQILRRLNSGLGSAGIRAELDQDGKLKFSMPENDWQVLKDQLRVKGEGKLFSEQPTAAQTHEDGLPAFNPALARDSFRELRQLLDSVVSMLDKVGNLREQINQRQQDVRDFLARQESLDEQQWARTFAGAVFNINSRKSSSYAVVSQTVVAQAQLTRFAVVSLLS